MFPLWAKHCSYRFSSFVASSSFQLSVGSSSFPDRQSRTTFPTKRTEIDRRLADLLPSMGVEVLAGCCQIEHIARLGVHRPDGIVSAGHPSPAARVSSVS